MATRILGKRFRVRIEEITEIEFDSTTRVKDKESPLSQEDFNARSYLRDRDTIPTETIFKSIDCLEKKTVELEIYDQQVSADGFELKNVIKAVNGL